MVALEQELSTYEAKREELLAREGQYVVIHHDEILGIYAAYEDALKAGYERVGVEPFLVKRIAAVDNICQFTREIIVAPPEG